MLFPRQILGLDGRVCRVLMQPLPKMHYQATLADTTSSMGRCPLGSCHDLLAAELFGIISIHEGDSGDTECQNVRYPYLFPPSKFLQLAELWSPKDVHVLVPKTCEYITLHSKKDFAGVIKDLKMGRLSWIIQVGPMQWEEPF